MNLYKQTFEHWAPKDSEKGIKKYFIAENDREAYDVVYDYDCMTVDKFCDFNSEEYDVFEIDYEEYDIDTLNKEKVIGIVADKRGELNFEGLDSLDCFEDLYYGLTLEGWELMKENISVEEIALLRRIGILGKDAQ